MSLTTSSLSPNFGIINHSQQFKGTYNKDPVFKFLNNTCLEKPKFTDIKFNKETQDIINSVNEGYFRTHAKPFNSEGFNKMSLSSKVNNSNPISLRDSIINESYPKVLPQWIKYDKQVLKFTAYFNEHVEESNVENFRVRTCYIFFYLDDETIQVFEVKTENSGIPQGTIIKRQRITKEKKGSNEETVEFINYKDLMIGNQLNIYGKIFKICDCDDFTRKFLESKGFKLQPNEPIPEYVNSNEEIIKRIDGSENMKNIADYKEFCEVKLGGGHPNRLLKNFLKNDRKVLSFDIIWDDVEHDKEVKPYKMNYYLAESKIEVREIKVNNSGKDNFPYLLKKSYLPKKPNFTYCPGLNAREEIIYKPEDLIIGNYVNIFNRPCFILDCDDFTKQWYKENLGIDIKPIRRKTDPPRKVVHDIPPNNGFGSDEDSLLTVFYLNPQVKVRRVTENFKKDKHILRFNAKIINQSQNEAERKFVFSFFVSEEILQIFEEAGKNSGRVSAKFMERRKVKNPITSKYYVEKDFYVGANIYINKYIFKLYECDEKTKSYMMDNHEIFRDSDIGKIVRRIQAESSNFKSLEEYLATLLAEIDPSNKGHVSPEEIVIGLKSFELHLSQQEQVTLFDYLNPIKDERGLINMEEFFDLVKP